MSETNDCNSRKLIILEIIGCLSSSQLESLTKKTPFTYFKMKRVNQKLSG